MNTLQIQITKSSNKFENNPWPREVLTQDPTWNRAKSHFPLNSDIIYIKVLIHLKQKA